MITRMSWCHRMVVEELFPEGAADLTPLPPECNHFFIKPAEEKSEESCI